MMQRKCFPLLLLAIVFTLTTIILIGCANSSEGKSAAVATATDSGKIPVTSSSVEAAKEFLAGRDLAERLRITDSLQHYDKAISLDPNFAAAELNRATSSPTAKEFFEHLKQAVSLSDKASKGERLQILAAEAGANGDPAKQKQLLEELVTSFPNDERAHFALGGYYFGQQEYDKAIDHY